MQINIIKKWNNIAEILLLMVNSKKGKFMLVELTYEQVEYLADLLADSAEVLTDFEDIIADILISALEEAEHDD